MAAAALLALLMALPAAAQEEGAPVLVGGRPAVGVFNPFNPAGAGGVLLEIGPSAPFPEPFDALLFQGELPDAAVSFEAAREENGVWSAWLRAALHRTGDGRFWGKVVFPKAGAGRVRLRALSPGGSSAPVTVYALEVFLSGGERPGAPGSGPAVPEGVEPLPVIERDAWKAKPPKQAYEPHVPDRVTQHHSAGRLPGTLDESLAEVLFIQDFHQNGRGWNDIAYHFMVDPEGRIFRGRPVGVVGSHTLNDNKGNVGICFMGDHHPPANHPVASAELAASVRIGRWLQAGYGVTPASYSGHRDRNPGHTDCPGDILYALLPKVREDWSARSGFGARLQAWFRGLRLTVP